MLKPDSKTFMELTEKGRQIQEKVLDWQRHRSNEIDAGELFCISMPLPFPLVWCAVFQHPRNAALWFCVPGDSFSIATAADVEVAGSEVREPLIFRCNCGLWIHRDDIDLNSRFDQLEAGVCRTIRATVSAIAKNPVAILADDDSAEDPDYIEWITELRMAVDALAHLLHDDHESTVRLVGKESSITKAAETLSLAAAPTESVVAENEPRLLDIRSLDDIYYGTLRALLYTDGVVIDWTCNDEDIPAPPLVYAGKAVRWLGTVGHFYSSTVPWSDDQVTLKIGLDTVTFPKD